MKKLITLIFLGCLATTTMFGQLNISTSFPNPAPGANTTVDFTVSGFTDIVSGQFTINYDPAVLDFSSVSYTNILFNGLSPAAFGAPPNTTPGTITFSWFDSSLSGVTVPDGTLMFSLDFVAIGADGTNSAISFGNSPTPTEFSDSNFQTLSTSDFTLTNGNVPIGTPGGGGGGGGGNGSLGTAFSCPIGATGDNICLDVTVDDFDLIQGFQYTVNFDPAVLQFTGTAGYNLVDLDASNFGNGSGGDLTVSWFEASGAGATVADGTVIYQMCFNVIGAGGSNSPISISGNVTPIEVTQSGTAGANIGLDSTPCNFTTAGTGGTAVSVEAGSLSGAPGSTVCVPYTASNFTDIVSLQYVMNYDNTVLQFSSVANINPAFPGLSNASFNTMNPGSINFSWFDSTLSGVTVPNGATIYEVCYDIIGALGNSSTLSYDTFTEATQNQPGGGTDAVPLTTLPGSVGVVGAPGANFTVDAAEVNSDGATNVCVPFTVLNFSEIVSMQFDMTYDPSHLTFTGVNLTGNLNGLQSNNFNPTAPGNIRISWVTPNISTGETLTDGSSIYELCFDKQGAIGTSSVLSYDLSAVNEVSNAAGQEVVLKDFLDGSVTCTSGAAPLDVNATAPIVSLGCVSGEGAIDVTVAGGTLPITYSWSNGATTEDLTNLGPGDYTLTAMDGSGATSSTPAITITAPIAVTATSNATAESAANANDGAIDLTPAGGTAPYTFTWSNGETTEDISELAPSSYIVTITDNNGCSTTVGPITVSAFAAPPNVDNNATEVTDACGGSPNGMINIMLSGGTGPFTYSWSNGQTANPAVNLAAATYSVTVTDTGSSQTATGSFTVAASNGPDCSVATYTDDIGGNTGAIDLMPTGGTPPYTYQWHTGLTTEDISSLGFGPYFVTITDANGCTNECSHTVMSGNAFGVDQAGSTVVGATCAGTNNGSINLSVLGGSTPYTYLWSNGQTTANIAALMAGNYSVTVTDATGATTESQFPFTINEPASAVAVAIVTFTDETSGGTNDGTITASASGGTAPHTYAWSTGATGTMITGLTAGLYCVTVTDASGICTAETCQTINSGANPITLDFIVSDPACSGGQGGINVTPNGGTMPYSYAWEQVGVGPIIMNDFPNLGGIGDGTYAVTVTDVNGLQAFGSQTLAAPPATVLNGVASTSSGNDGAIDLTITGGSPAHQISWTGPGGFTATTEDISGLATGQYCVTTIDANACANDACFNVASVSNPPKLTGGPNNNGLVGTNVSCSGVNDGTITTTVSCGVGNLSFLWNTGLTTQNISGLAAGTYILVVTDENGDSDTATITITAPEPISTTGNTSPETAAGNDGAIDLVVDGACGASGNTFSWNGPNGFTSSSEDIFGLAAGQYVVNIQDCNGCMTTGIYNVSFEGGGGALAVNMANMIPADCNNQNGAITVSVVSGTAPFTYAWSNGAPSAPTITGLAADLYDVTVTDAAGQVGILTDIQVTSSMNATLIPDAGVTINPETEDGDDGQVNITPEGGCVPYRYLWSNGETTEDIVDLPQNDYRVTITDDCGCITVSNDFTVGFDAGIVSPSAIDIQEPSCSGDSDGRIDLTIDTPGDYTYAWSNGAATPAIFGLTGGTYDVTITDDNNSDAVVYTNTFTLEDPDPIMIAIDEIQHDGCSSGPGAIFVTITGGTFPIYPTTSWSNGATSQDLNPAPAGRHQLTVIDQNGCFALSEDIEVSDDPPCAIGEDITALSCSSDCNGAIDITVAGGTAPYNYTWSNGDTTEDIAGLCQGSYTVTITDANGLISIHTYSVSALTNGPQISGTATPSSGNDGGVNVSVTQGSEPYTFAWSTGAITEDISGLASGTYTLTVTDANGCTDVASFEVTSTTIAATVNNVDCFGNMNGSIDIAPGSTLIPPLTFSWNGPNVINETTEDLSGLEPGIYTIVITDGNSTTAEATYTISEGSNISTTITIDNDPTPGESDANATANPTGGNAPYSYLWSNGQVTQTLSNVPAGAYAVTITDGNGCTDESTINIGNGVIINLQIGMTSCAGECDGTATADVSSSVGTTPPYSYAWSDGQTTATAVGLCDSLIYTVTITDAVGNFSVGIASDIGPEPQNVTYTSTAVGDGTFNIELTATGGVEPYTYVWGPNITPAGNNSPIGVAPTVGSYNAIIMDANGCIFSLSEITVFDGDECLDFRQVITPNGDGLNDNFLMTCLEQYPNNELEIYSRWGELMWVAPGLYDNSWEGTNMAGELLPQGGYFFVFRFDDPNVPGDIKKRQIKGAITLLR